MPTRNIIFTSGVKIWISLEPHLKAYAEPKY